MSLLFFFNDTATTEIYTLSLHDALPIFFPAIFFEGLQRFRPEFPRPLGIFSKKVRNFGVQIPAVVIKLGFLCQHHQDRKSTRLNSSHGYISYAVFCLKKKNI